MPLAAGLDKTGPTEAEAAGVGLVALALTERPVLAGSGVFQDKRQLPPLASLAGAAVTMAEMGVAGSMAGAVVAVSPGMEATVCMAAEEEGPL